MQVDAHIVQIVVRVLLVKDVFYQFHHAACRKFIFEILTTYIHSSRKIDLFSIWNRYFSCNKRCVVIHNQFSKYFLEHKIFFLAYPQSMSTIEGPIIMVDRLIIETAALCSFLPFFLCTIALTGCV